MKNEKSDLIITRFSSYFRDEFPLLTYRSMFGGYGLCQNDVMFALVYDDTLYLRAPNDIESVFSQHNMNRLVLFRNNRPKSLQYYEVTEPLWQDLEQLKKFLSIAFSGAENAKKKKLYRLKDNPNISLQLERLLNKASIMTFEQLHEEGAVSVYKKLKQNTKNLSINILYALEAAIYGCHAAVLPQSQKEKLLFELQMHQEKASCN